MQRAVLNHKGGVGKSSISVDLAAPSAKADLKTSLEDLDVQANGTHYIVGKPFEPLSGVEDCFKTNYRCIQENRSSL